MVSANRVVEITAVRIHQSSNDNSSQDTLE